MKAKLLILAILFFGTVYSSEARGQTIQTVKGNFCGNSTWEHHGVFGLRLGTKVLFFQHIFWGIPKELTSYRNAQPKTDPVGTEYVVRYKKMKKLDQAVTITGTGRRKNIEPCDDKDNG